MPPPTEEVSARHRLETNKQTALKPSIFTWNGVLQEQRSCYFISGQLFCAAPAFSFEATAQAQTKGETLRLYSCKSETCFPPLHFTRAVDESKLTRLNSHPDSNHGREKAGFGLQGIYKTLPAAEAHLKKQECWLAVIYCERKQMREGPFSSL